MLPGATGDCGDEAGLGIGAEEKGSSGGPLNADVICVHSELMLSLSPSTSGTGGGNTREELIIEANYRLGSSFFIRAVLLLLLTHSLTVGLTCVLHGEVRLALHGGG